MYLVVRMNSDGNVVRVLLAIREFVGQCVVLLPNVHIQTLHMHTLVMA